MKEKLSTQDVRLNLNSMPINRDNKIEPRKVQRCLTSISTQSFWSSSFVLPMWMFLHYGSRWRANHAAWRHRTRKLLTDLWDAARRMEERLDNLERALGSENQRKS
jgi:phage shock protein B